MVIREEREKRREVESKAVDIIRVREPYKYNANSREETDRREGK